MARRLNKNMVAVLTLVGMVSATAVAGLMIWGLPDRDPGPYAQKASEQEAKGDYATALKYYQRAQDVARKAKRGTKEVGGYLVKAGDMALKTGDAGQAIKMWRDASLVRTDDSGAHERLVKLHVEIAKLRGGPFWPGVEREARDLLAIQGQEKNFIGLHALGLALVKQRGASEKNAEEGRKMLEEAVKGDKGNPDFADSLAEFHLQENQIDNAKHVYEELLAEENRPKDPKVWAVALRNRGKFFLELKRERNRKLQRRKDQRASAAEVAALQQEADSLDQKARADLEESLTKDDKSVETLVALGGYWHLKESSLPDAAARATEVDGFRAKAREYYENAVKADPEDFSGYMRLSQLYEQQGKVKEADEVLEQRMTRGIRKEHYLSWRNQLFMNMVREEAFRLNLRLLAKLPDKPEFAEERKKVMDRMYALHRKTIGESSLGEQDPAALFMQGQLHWIKSQTPGADPNEKRLAVKCLEEARDRSGGGSLSLRRMLASLYLETGVPGLAEELLKGLTNQLPTDDWAWAMLAQVNIQLSAKEPNRLNNAVELAKTAQRLNPESATAKQALFDAYTRLHDYKSITELVPKGNLASTEDKFTRATAMIAEVPATSTLADSQALREAQQGLQEVLDKDPLHLRALRQLVTLLTRSRDGHEQARKVLAVHRTLAEKALAAATGSEADETRKKYNLLIKNIDLLAIYADEKATPQERFARTKELIEREPDVYTREVELFELYRRTPDKQKEAFPHLKKAYELKPNEGNLISTLFQYALSEKNWSLAEECVTKAVAMNLDGGEGHFFRGQMFMTRGDQGENLNHAVREFRAGLTASPSYSNGHLYLGNALLQLRYFDEAKREFEEADRLNPANSLATVGKAMVAVAQGDEAGAKQLLDRCAQVAPNDPWVKTQLQNREDQRDPLKGIARRVELRKQKPDDLDNLTHLAELYMGQTQYDLAGEVLADAFKRYPDNLALVHSYAVFLRTKHPAEPARGEKILRDLEQRIPENKKIDKASVHLMVAEHLRVMVQTNQPGALSLAELDQFYISSDAINPSPEVRVEIGLYFIGSGRDAMGEEWFRKANAVATEPGQAEIKRRGRSLLIESMIRGGDSERFREIQQELDSYRKEFPDDKRVFLFQGELNALAGRDPEAIEQFTQFVNQSSNPIMGYYRRGNIRFRRSEFEEAITDLEKVKQQIPDFSGYEARILLAKARNANKQKDRAVEELQSILRDNDHAIAALQELFQIYMTDTPPKLDSAQRLIEPRMVSEPNNPAWPHLLAAVSQARGDKDRAIELAQQAVKLSRMQSSMVNALLSTYVQLRRFDDAISYVNQQIPPDKRGAATHVILAAAQAGKKDVAQCLEHVIQAFNSFGISMEELYRTFVLEISPQLDKSAAMAVLTRRLEKDPKDQAALFFRAALSVKQNTDVYIQSLQQLLDLVSKDAAASKARRTFVLRQLAVARRERRELQEVRKLYEEILTMHPDDLFSLNNLAALLTDDLKEPLAAIVHAQRAAELVPSNPAVLDTLGWAQVQSGKIPEGLAELKRAVALGPSLATIHYHLAVAHLRRSEMKGAPSPQEDKFDAQRECKRAHALVMQAGADTERIFDQILILGDKLGLSLEKKLATAQPIGR